MKRLFLSGLLALAFFSTEARRIPQPEAAQLAAKFLQAGPQKRMVRALLPTPKHLMAKGQSAEQAPFYVYNAEGGKGFVIISGDDAVGTVLAYADTGQFSFTDAPENLLFWMKVYAQRIAAIEEDEPGAPTAPAAPQAVVGPLLGEIKWGQDTPYNNNCPTWVDNGKTRHYYVGCVATACTQIMRFHKYPQHGTGSHSYKMDGQTLSANFADATYDWDKMLPSYAGEYTDEQAGAVASIASDFGISVNMHYTKTGSGAYSQAVPYALRTYFGYDNAVEMKPRDYYPTKEWISMIKQELDAGRPVYYAASAEDGRGGHAFVCDGYDDQDYVHINWGWHGTSDGFFMVNHLNPSALGIGASSTGFNVNQEIIVNVKPAGGSAQPVPYAIYSPSRLGLMSYEEDMTMMAYIENYEMMPVDLKVAPVLVQGDKIVKRFKEEPVHIEACKAGRTGYTSLRIRNIPKAVAGVADGDYTIHFAYFADGMSDWKILRHPLSLPAYGDISVSNGRIVDAKIHAPHSDVKLLTPIHFDGPLYANGIAKASFTLQNRSKDFPLKAIAFHFTSVDDPSVTDTVFVRAGVYEESTKEMELLMDLGDKMKPGKYTLALYDATKTPLPFDDAEVGRATVEILPEADAPVLRQTSPTYWLKSSPTASGPVKQGTPLYFAFYARNYCATGDVGIVTYLKGGPKNQEYVFLQVDKNIERGAQVSNGFYKAAGLEPGTYTIGAKYITSRGLEDLPTPFDSTKIVISENEELSLTCEALEFPTEITSDTRYEGKVTLKALKDYNGKVYVRLRQFTDSNGEIVYMGNLKLKAGESKEIKFKYKPGQELLPNNYLVKVDEKAVGEKAETPVGGYDNYYRIVKYTNATAIEAPVVASSAPVSVYQVGNRLHFKVPANVHVQEVSLYSLSGALCVRTAAIEAGLEAPSPRGVYILRIRTDHGTSVRKMFVE